MNHYSLMRLLSTLLFTFFFSIILYLSSAKANDLLAYSKMRASEAILDVEIVLKCATPLVLENLIEASEIIEQTKNFIHIETTLENCEFKTLLTKYYFYNDFTAIWNYTE